MLTTTEGIVLKTQKYGEADSIITHLTLCRGIIKTFARSPRKTKSRFGSSLEPFTHARITLWGKEQSMPRITQSDILKPFQRLRENFQDFIHTSKLAEILISIVPEGIPNSRLFSFFLNSMNFIESLEQEQKEALYLICQIRLLSILGYAPRLKDCGKCGEKSLEFYPDSGTILCRECAVSRHGTEAPPVRITKKTISFYSQSLQWPHHALKRLKPAREIISEISLLLDKHIKHLLNKELQTSEFLARV